MAMSGSPAFLVLQSGPSEGFSSALGARLRGLRRHQPGPAHRLPQLQQPLCSASLASGAVVGAVAAAVVVVVASNRSGRSRRKGEKLGPSRVSLQALDGSSLIDDSPLDLYPAIPDDSEPMEPAEPATLLEVRGELVLVRAGKGLQLAVRAGATVVFSGGAEGVFLAWKEDVGVLHVVSGKVLQSESVRATGALMSTSSGPALRGRILDSWGQPLDGRPPPPVPADQRRTFVEFKSMQERTNQYRALFTGVQGVDFAVPIGRGQTMLFQGTNPEEDRRHLWPDLMASEPQPGCRAKGAETVGPGGWKANDPRGQTVNVAVCRTLADAEELRSKLEARGCWERCTIIVPQSDSPGAGMIALSAALSFAESFSEKDGEALVLGEFESMHRVWNALADVAGQERQAKGILVDPADSNWVDMAGTILRESIAERRKFWFNLVSRAANSVDGGSVSLLGWLWEKEGGLDFRRKQAYEKRVKQVMAIPRISDDIRQKMLDKLKDEAQSSGALVATSAAQEPDDSSPGVPNWEIEELKSITDGHILLRPHESADWRWSVDAYRSLPRLGTDALHPALISVDAPKLRLKMMQGRDRANFLQDTRGAPQTLDKKRAVQIELLELVLQQPAGRSFSVQQEVARLMIASEPDCKRLRDCEVSQRSEVLDSLTEDLLVSAPGQRAVAQILETGDISQEAYDELAKEVELR